MNWLWAYLAIGLFWCCVAASYFGRRREPVPWAVHVVMLFAWPVPVVVGLLAAYRELKEEDRDRSE